MNKSNTYIRLLSDRLKVFNPENIRFGDFDNKQHLMFDVLIENTMKTCIVLVDLSTTKYMIQKELKKNFLPNFIEVYKWLTETDEDADDEDIYWCEKDDEEYESIDSVAEGCGFYIDDDGHWIPLDDDIFSWNDCYDGPFEIECMITLSDGTKRNAVEYSTFILY
ncbi:hypothetical protein F4V43_02460 [Paenibacillus spiritus]|uniref:Uncharacterized protein n=1 Tax=Paenibacillus spiritus TaxID=2496557 RepID=A0A5J5GGN2_9BACL|nr:hypothetical protein [Paenibacillus spiritus]KAA9007369.1 hypothetical protein F4V43_02460 [Paenibacillus spiritus]